MRAYEIANETAKTGKVTAIVELTSIYCRKKHNSQSLVLETRSLIATRQKMPSYWSKIPANQETFLRK
jgi:hypothetical protein